MSDAIVRLLLNTSGFESNLSRAKGRMRDFSSQGSSTSSVLKGLGGTLTKLTGGLAAAGTAMKVATDAFKTSEMNVDEWGRTVESAKGLYEGFLNSLNTGDISGFLNNIQQIVSAAREAYDALDDLSTYKAFNQVNLAKAKARYAEALEKYKANPTAENKADLAQANEALVRLIKEEAEKQRIAYDASVKELLQNKGLSGQALKEAIGIIKNGSNAEFENVRGQYKRDDLIDSMKKGVLGHIETFRGMRVTTTANGAVVELDKFGKYVRQLLPEEEKQYKIAKALNDLDDEKLGKVQAVGAQYAQLLQAAYDQTRSFNRMAGNNKTDHPKKDPPVKEELVYSETASNMKQMKDNITILTEKMQTLTIGTDEYIQTLRDLTHWQQLVKKQQTRDSDISNFYSGKTGQGIRIAPTDRSLFQSMTPEQAKKMEHLDLPKQKQPEVKTDDKDRAEAVKGLVGGVDTIVSSLEGLGVDVGSGFKKGLKLIQSIIAIVEGIKAIESAVQILTSGRDTVYQAAVVSELGVIATATAMTAGFQAVKAIPIIGWALKEGGVVHAAGGVVMGQNYVDRVPATLSSGEMVLNPAQQSKLFKMANSGGGEAAASQPYVNAETIVLGIQNWAKRRGKGSELMFTQR